jgi:putative hydrolase of the HAD superfamily
MRGAALHNRSMSSIDPAFAHIETWIFDLDNTLYPPSCDLFEFIEARMNAYVVRLLGCSREEAERIQKGFYHEHGATLAGLMANHGVDPAHFLDEVHDIPLDRLSPDPLLVNALAALPGRRLVHTNGDAAYAARVVQDIIASDYRPKPDPHGYDGLIARFGIDPRRAAFFEDMARNLEPAKARGVTTIWYNNGVEGGDRGSQGAYIDYEARDLAPFLRRILGEDDAP